jgi:hypothetical protein
LLTKNERNTVVEELPASCVDQAQAFELLNRAVSGWSAAIVITPESQLISIEHAGHVVVCSVPEAPTPNGRMSIKLKWEQGTKQVVWVGICADLLGRLRPLLQP